MMAKILNEHAKISTVVDFPTFETFHLDGAFVFHWTRLLLMTHRSATIHRLAVKNALFSVGHTRRNYNNYA